jgi:hypothetical protein
MSNTKGTILYFAILILSVIFAIAMGLSLIIFGQLKTQREIGYSVIALSAADTGVERALYAIYKEGNMSFSTSTNLENGANYTVNVFTTSAQCGSSIQYYCIISRGTFKNTTRAINASF